MSKRQKNIDKIYREKHLKSIARTPEFAWDRIEKELDVNTQKKRVVIYRRIAAIAAISVILMGSGLLFMFNQNKNIKKEIIAQQSEDTIHKQVVNKEKEPIAPLDINNNEKINSEREAKTNKEAEKSTYIASTILNSEEITTRSISELTLISTVKSVFIDNPTYYKLSIIRQDLASLQKAIDNGSEMVNALLGLDNNDLLADADINKVKATKWSLGGGFSPAYQTNNVSFFPRTMADNVFDPGDGILGDDIPAQTENEINTYTGGVNVNYQLSKRWSIQSGINYLQQGLKIDNFYIIEDTYGGANNYANTSNGYIEIKDVEYITLNAPLENDIIVNFAQNAKGYGSYLRQSFEFIEIPFIFRYKFVNKKLGMYLLSGINTNIMVGNNVFLGSDNKNNIGTTADVNKLIYSSLLGFTIEYPLFKRLQFSISPALKYQINSIRKGSGDFMNTRLFDFKTGLVYTFE